MTASGFSKLNELMDLMSLVAPAEPDAASDGDELGARDGVEGGVGGSAECAPTAGMWTAIKVQIDQCHEFKWKRANSAVNGYKRSAN